ncbi:MAG: glycosyltransferase family 2 protein [Lautropia sp.]|nr:glycosyltransferase family 2 protein [Lautropia sp.]
MKTIALTMIVKNEERCLARCLESVRPWVDRMIVLDTGSTDRTMEIAREHGAEVFERRWTNDFAAARNAALARSDADWNLVLDADETLIQGGEYLRKMREMRDRAVHNICVESDIGHDAMRMTTTHMLPRLLPRGVRYKNRIHEQPSHNLPVVDSPIVVLHDGYMLAQTARKTGRNMELLKQAVQEHPNEPYFHYQLGKEYDLGMEQAMAVACYQKATELTVIRAVWHHDMMVRMIECLRQLGRLEEGMMYASDQMGLWPDSPDFYFVTAHLLLDQMEKRPEQGPALLPMIESSLKRALDIGERPDLAGSIAGRGTFMAAEKLWAVYTARKDMMQATHYRQLADSLMKTHQQAEKKRRGKTAGKLATATA